MYSTVCMFHYVNKTVYLSYVLAKQKLKTTAFHSYYIRETIPDDTSDYNSIID